MPNWSAPAIMAGVCYGSVADMISSGAPAASRRFSSTAQSFGRYRARSITTLAVSVTTARVDGDLAQTDTLERAEY
ncbi:hypothetical protein ACWDWS_38055 [Streptomyces sp. NPDC003328]|uniref:hypothetical protein n=1 Tax=Streptomyces sp. NPDC003737 TaxID=3364685 RepID=UPI003684FE1F